MDAATFSHALSDTLHLARRWTKRPRNERVLNDFPHSGGDLNLVAVVSESTVPFSSSAPSDRQAQYARMLEEVTVWFYPT